MPLRRYTRIKEEVEAKLQAVMPDPFMSIGLPHLSPASSRAVDATRAASPPVALPQRHEPCLQFQSQNIPENERHTEGDTGDDQDFILKQELMAIVDSITSEHSSEQLDGLLMLGVFLEENQQSLNWDGFLLLFLELLNFIPEQLEVENGNPGGLSLRACLVQSEASSDVLVYDVVCHCISQMCSNSDIILERATSLKIVPRITNLLKCAQWLPLFSLEFPNYFCG